MILDWRPVSEKPELNKPILILKVRSEGREAWTTSYPRGFKNETVSEIHRKSEHSTHWAYFDLPTKPEEQAYKHYWNSKEYVAGASSRDCFIAGWKAAKDHSK